MAERQREPTRITGFLVGEAKTNPGARFLAARGSLAEQISISDDFEFTDEELDEMLDASASE